MTKPEATHDGIPAASMGQRPSLLAAAAAAPARAAPGVSILDALQDPSNTASQPGDKPASRRGAWAVAAFLACLAVGLLAASQAWRSADREPAAAAQMSAPAIKPVTVAVAPLPPPLPEPASAATAARIEDVPTPVATPVAATEPSAPTALTPAVQTAAAAQAPSPEVVPVRPARRTAAAETRPRPPAARPVAAPPGTATVAVARTESETTRPVQPAARPAPATTATDRRADPDVDLMAALMQHLANGKDGASAVDAVMARASAAPTVAAVTAAPAKAKAPITIASLVASCKQKPAREAAACKRDICEGYWGKAQACPLRERPQASRAAAKKPRA